MSDIKTYPARKKKNKIKPTTTYANKNAYDVLYVV